ncbi:MAG: hypothetical protein QMD46_02645 [Methanomicrobiales archaeon]|nr:hypothetical protein [Methanomicrobiales archaeon]MDI6875338.1 hypothetical protein [Methanomicrobiales archaeon]
MRLLDRLMKLFIASMFAGALMRCAVPLDLDLFGIGLDFMYNVICLQHAGLSPETAVAGDYTISLMILPIALIPFLYAALNGRWSVASYLTGFFAGYSVTDYLRLGSPLALITGLAFFGMGVFLVLFSRSLKIRG